MSRWSILIGISEIEIVMSDELLVMRGFRVLNMSKLKARG
jgi:hypothetical protein